MERHLSERPSQPTWERPLYTPTVMPPAAPQAPPVTIQVSIAPQMTNSNHQDGNIALLAGFILGFAAGWYLSQEDEASRGRR
jgi:hypothetical protein